MFFIFLFCMAKSFRIVISGTLCHIVLTKVQTLQTVNLLEVGNCLLEVILRNASVRVEFLLTL